MNIRHIHLRLIGIIFVFCILACGVQASGTPASPTPTDTPLPTMTLAPTEIPEALAGNVITEEFILPAGRSVKVTGDLVLTASGQVDIAGDLLGEAGASISIQAEGDINIAGNVLAGDANPGEKGGDLTLISNSGDISLQNSAGLASGNGGMGVLAGESDGEMTLLSGGHGGNGGGLTLKAPNGTLTVPQVEGILHVGDGGDGSEIAIHGEDLYTTRLEEQLTNGGGDSGELALEAGTVLGVEFVEITLEGEFSDPWSGEIYPAGTVLTYPKESSLMSGGRGGHAGSLFYGMDEQGDSTWPEAEGTSYIPEEQVRKLVAAPIWPLASVASAPSRLVRLVFPQNIPDKVETGAAGGDGFYGGDGGDVMLQGEHGYQLGQTGQYVEARGGNGGAGTYIGGNGGFAVAKGGNGADAREPGGQGGNGGYALALAGSAGSSAFGPNARDGDAHARGGHGGVGGGICPDKVVDTGGNGGKGGGAYAESKNKVVAIGGDGGLGGDGQVFGGTGGYGAIDAIADGSDSKKINGLDGSKGDYCPPAPKGPCGCSDAIGFKEIFCKDETQWGDCGEVTACDSILDDKKVENETVITSSDGLCQMKVFCP